jgi:hypothetical protein
MKRRIVLWRLSALTIVALATASVGAASAEAAAPAWQVLAATGPTDLPPVTKEVQRLSVDAGAGTFTLGFEGEQTEPLPFDAESTAIQAALDRLPGIGNVGGAVEVTGGPGNPGGENAYFVSFGGTLAGHDVDELTSDGGGLQGGAAAITVTTVVEGKEFFEAGSLSVSVTNVGGAASSFLPTLTVDVGPLPRGIEARPVEEERGWSCPVGAEGSVVACTHLFPVGALESADTFRIPLTVHGPDVAQGSSLHLEVEGGEAAPVEADVPLVIASTPAKPGVAAFWAGAFDADGRPETRAGAHPYSASSAFWVNTVLAPDGVTIVPAGALRTAKLGLPPGFLGDPLATQQRCPQAALAENPGTVVSPACTSIGSLVGTLYPAKGAYSEVSVGPLTSFSPIFNDIPALGTAAQFTANIAAFGEVSFLGSVRSGEDFGVDLGAFNLSTQQPVYGSVTTLEGFPASALGKPLLRNPTDCSAQGEEAAAGRGPRATLQTNSWTNSDPSGIEDEKKAPQPVVAGCKALTEAWVGAGPEPNEEAPSFAFQPSVTQASSGTGATARIHVPQRGLTDPDRLGSADLKKTVVSLPRGISLNPSAANGLQACSETQVGVIGSGLAMPNPIRFDEKPVTCPEASRLGTVQIRSPLLEEELEGTIYLAAQEENPFHSLIALYLVVESERFGIILKLPGEVRADPATGQLTAVFDDNPQLPFEELTLRFRGGGPRSELATPALCGSYRSSGSLTPWSAESESQAEAAQIAEGGFQVDSGPRSGGCATTESALPFSPSFEAGTGSTQAGAYAPLVVKVGRDDGEQELTHLDFTLPPGVTAKLAGVEYCPQSAIEEAERESGKSEQADPSCPASSRIGTVETAAGVGSEPIHVGGDVYLAGPYGGAPLSSVVITPAVAGPFDLGSVVVRAPLFVNPETAQITARSEEIPHILRGIPLKLRSIEIKVDRQDFSLNPTSCNAMSASSTMSGLNGASASSSVRFQVGGCQALPFRPDLKLRVIGKTNRDAKPRLKAVLTARPGEANIRRAQVNLPHSEFLEQAHIKTICSRAQFAQGDGNGSACPKGSIYGRAKVWTPLLDQPLEGPVYLRSSSNKLPDLVAALDGQIDIALDGKIDSGKNRGIRNTFEVVPDAPVSRFVLEMNGGKKGLLVNSENLCSSKAKRDAIVRLSGQNGKVRAFKPRVANSCPTHKKSKGQKGKR